MAHIKSRDIDQMNPEQRERRLAELRLALEPAGHERAAHVRRDAKAPIP